MAEYLSNVDTAKLVRRALKEAFPGVKFSVRCSCYAGGASIGVTWIDGPNDAMVNAVASKFAGSYFDAQIDLKGSRFALMDGQQVSFGADYVFTKREYTAAFLERALAKAVRYWGAEAMAGVEVKDSTFGAHFVATDYGTAYRKANAEAARLTTYLAPRASKTAARVIYLGNDGHSDVGALRVEGQAA